MTSTVEYVVVLFTGPCDEAARNTECEVCLNQEKGFLSSLFDVSLLQEIIEELETIDDEVDSYGMALVTTEVKCEVL